MGILISLGAVSPVIIAVPKHPVDRIATTPSFHVESRRSTISLNYFGQVASYRLDKTSIGGINVEMEPAQIVKILGKPIKMSEKVGCIVEHSLIYDGLRIKVSESEAIIHTTNSNYRTDLGIKVGDTISKAEKMYDGKLGFRSKKQRGLITYQQQVKRDSEISLILEIGHKNGRVTHIEHVRIVHEDC